MSVRAWVDDGVGRVFGRVTSAEGPQIVAPSTYVVLIRKLSTFVDESSDLVENLVDVVGASAYCPTSALLLRTVARVTALAKGRGKPGHQLNQCGKTEVRRVRAKTTPGAARL